ncbi:hypothetical protein EIN_359270 [Entamoeba invadens IP1]|uniref:Uncharacterized protein n=1 Tax=Entamoeba invadens IP1 TaxID=370355 RepID=A0A0A1UDM3_ENTIV|nr:hypothetical protein EIN_359270 [Entamoeba invadens IP1]ELP90844.1 hypothetical protein EIN_359270 [Entamoeba invadens IP1]|eukprot:XP_004257615.1 hypothetical protein EIN_359270 [Entamoeba invadens IP1]
MSNRVAIQIPSEINSVLLSQNCTLERLLSMPELQSELRYNKRLQRFICDESVLQQLFKNILDDSNPKLQSQATKVVCANVLAITENIFYFPNLISSLLQEFITSKSNVTISSISKVLTVLLDIPTSNVFEMMKSMNDIVCILLSHIANYELKNFIKEIVKITSEDGSNTLGALYLYSQNIVRLLVSKFLETIRSELPDEEVLENIVDVLQAISSINGCEERFVADINSCQKIKELFDTIFDAKSKSTKAIGFKLLSICLTQSSVVYGLCECQRNALPQVYQLLFEHIEELKREMFYESGCVTVVRMECIKIVNALTLSYFKVVYEEFVTHNVLDILLKIFFSYQHNCTLIRQDIYTIVEAIASRGIPILEDQIFNTKFYNMLIEEDKKCIQYKDKNGYYPEHQGLLMEIMNTVYICILDEPEFGSEDFVEYYSKSVSQRRLNGGEVSYKILEKDEEENKCIIDVYEEDI